MGGGALLLAHLPVHAALSPAPPPPPPGTPFPPPLVAGSPSDKAPGELDRLTGCWDERYEFYAWSNAVCVDRAHPLYPEMEVLSGRHGQYPGLYHLQASE